MTSRSTKRSFINDTTLTGAGVFNEVVYNITVDKVNCFNIWGSISIEPENADANAQGSWILYATKTRDSGITWNDTQLNDEPEAETIIAAGVWGATNQTPFNHTFSAGSVSRNIRGQCLLALQVFQTGISAGASSVRMMLLCNMVQP